VLRLPTAEVRYRMYYTRSGPSHDYTSCKAEILSALSDDCVSWHPEEGARLLPEPGELRVVCPEVVLTADGKFRMYYESQPAAAADGTLPPAVIRSAISDDGLNFVNEGVDCLADPEQLVSFGSPRCVYLDDGSARLYSRASDGSGDVNKQVGTTMSIVCAVGDGLSFTMEGTCISQETAVESVTVYAPAVCKFRVGDGWGWRMYYAGWGGPPTRGYICSATSSDGVSWEKDPSPVLAPDSAWDGVKCSEPDIVELDGGGFRLFYEACDGTAEGETGVWRILGASSRRAAL